MSMRIPVFLVGTAVIWLALVTPGPNVVAALIGGFLVGSVLFDWLREYFNA